jgi:hypothetical protein
LSTILAVMTFAVVWLVVSPAKAMAMAPLCDPRGAIGFAPPPQLQNEERSLDIPVDCVFIDPLETKFYEQRGPSKLDLTSSQEPLAPSVSTLVPAPFVVRLPVPPAIEARPPPGVLDTIERPPRG